MSIAISLPSSPSRASTPETLVIIFVLSTFLPLKGVDVIFAPWEGVDRRSVLFLVCLGPKDVSDVAVVSCLLLFLFLPWGDELGGVWGPGC